MNIDYSNALTPALPRERLVQSVPAAFAERAASEVSANYVFISTAQLIDALMDAGLQPVNARQTRSRGDRIGYSRHMIRFREIRQSVTLKDCVPEIVLINSHDATSSYQLRAGLYRPVCTNGLMCHVGDFGVVHVPHRGNVLGKVVEGATSILQGFATIGETIERMQHTLIDIARQLEFAAGAARIRYKEAHVPYEPGRLLEARREPDQGNDVWRVYNVVQENVIRGGIAGRTALGRSMRSRRIGAIREDVRINTALWHLAMNLLRD